jgi:ketosteroid isomerase-like protein
MSQENVEIVRRCYELVAERDFSLIPELANPDFVFDLSRNIFNPAIYYGQAGFRQFIEQVDEMWEDFHIEAEELIDGGGQVFAAVRIEGKGRASGVETAMRTFSVWKLRDGKVQSVTGGYRDRAEALEAAGLSE